MLFCVANHGKPVLQKLDLRLDVRLAPRDAMVRIATGQDTSDTAFMTVTRGFVALHSMQVTAALDGRDLSVDDPSQLIALN